MKKIIAIILTLVMVCSFAACGKGDDAEAPKPDEAPTTPAGILLADFKAKMAEGGVDTAEAMANALVENEVIEFMPVVMPVEPGYLNGFSEEITGFEEGAVFSPMIGAIPFVGYVFKLADDADAAEFVQTLKDKADLRWNICTQADEMMCEASGNTVFFVMSPLNFEEE